MTSMASATSVLPDTSEAVTECVRQLTATLNGIPDHLFCVASECHSLSTVAALIAQIFPRVALHCLTSCIGVTSCHGLEVGGLGMLAIADGVGAFGSSCQSFVGDPRGAAGHALIQATRSAGRVGELPTLIVVTSTPGYEEQVLAGIQEVVGLQVPIIGGSAADDAIAGRWSVQAGFHHTNAGCAVSVWYPTCRVAYRFHSGYEVTKHTGVVTAARGRTILTIDERPAACWYNDAIGGCLNDRLKNGGSVLMDTTLNPLGRLVGHLSGVPHYQLSHPECFTAEGDLTLFTEIHAGDTVVLMAGCTETLIKRAGQVVASALCHHGVRRGDTLGALVIYCAGCMLTVRERMNEVAIGINQALGGAPFLAAHTFGEQGCFPDGANRHGNLMISTVVLQP